MKLHKLFTIAMILLAVVAGSLQTVSAQKKKTPPVNRNWVVFTGYQTVAVIRNPVAAKYTCENSIYATANFAAPIDLSDGFYVTISADGQLVIQEKMTVDGNPGALRSIPVDIVPDDDAELGFPDASLAYSHALLNELKAGVHTITVAVSVGEGADEQIAAGTFSFDNRRGCAERFERVGRLINGSGTAEAEMGETEVEQTEDENTDVPATPRPNVRPQPQPTVRQEQQTTVQPERREDSRPEPAKPAENPEVEIYNSCGETRYVQIEYPSGSSDNINFHGTSEYHRYPLGTKIYVVIDGDKQLIDTVVANPSDTSYGRQKISLCK